MIRLDNRDSLIVDTRTLLDDVSIDIVARFQSPEFTSKQINDPKASPTERRRRARAVCVQDAVFRYAAGAVSGDRFFRIRLGSVDLVGLVIRIPTSFVETGLVFTQVTLTRNDTVNDVSGLILVSGYPMVERAIGWPDFPLIYPGEGNGISRSLTVFGISPGVPFSIIGTDFQREVIKNVTCILNTSSFIANRIVRLTLADNISQIVYEVAAPIAQIASTSQRYTFTSVGFATASPDSAQVMAMPEFDFANGYRVIVSADNMDSADTWSSVAINAQIWVL